MHYVTEVEYETSYRLLLTFEDGSRRRVDLAPHLDGEMFEPLRSLERFRTARLNADIDTVVWDNGADMSPDFLYEIGEPVDDTSARKVAEDRVDYGREGDGSGSVKA
jgi:hypothetical protein